MGKLLVVPQRPQRQQLSGAQSARSAALPEQLNPGGVSAKPRAYQLQGQQLGRWPLSQMKSARPCRSGPPRQCAMCRVYRAVLRLCNSSWRPGAQPRSPLSSSDCPLQLQQGHLQLQHLMVCTALLLPLLALLQLPHRVAGLVQLLPLAAQLRPPMPPRGALAQHQQRFETHAPLTSSALQHGRQFSR